VIDSDCNERRTRVKMERAVLQEWAGSERGRSVRAAEGGVAL